MFQLHWPYSREVTGTWFSTWAHWVRHCTGVTRGETRHVRGCRQTTRSYGTEHIHSHHLRTPWFPASWTVREEVYMILKPPVWATWSQWPQETNTLRACGSVFVFLLVVFVCVCVCVCVCLRSQCRAQQPSTPHLPDLTSHSCSLFLRTHVWETLH